MLLQYGQSWIFSYSCYWWLLYCRLARLLKCHFLVCPSVPKQQEWLLWCWLASPLWKVLNKETNILSFICLDSKLRPNYRKISFLAIWSLGLSTSKLHPIWLSMYKSFLEFKTCLFASCKSRKIRVWTCIYWRSHLCFDVFVIRCTVSQAVTEDLRLAMTYLNIPAMEFLFLFFNLTLPLPWFGSMYFKKIPELCAFYCEWTYSYSSSNQLTIELIIMRETEFSINVFRVLLKNFSTDYTYHWLKEILISSIVF